VAGSSGWRINGDGTAEFSGVVVRGTVIANAGLIGGNTINSTGLQSSNYQQGTSGWMINSDGYAEFLNVRISGSAVLTSDSFAVTLNPQNINESQTLSQSFSFNMARPGRVIVISRVLHGFSGSFTTFDEYKNTVFVARITQSIYVDGSLAGGFANMPLTMSLHNSTAKTIYLGAGNHTYSYNITYNGAVSGSAWVRPRPGFLDAVILKIYD
jgi:hypothetical protein